MQKITTIIVAGGIGGRMNSETPKQFLPLGRIPVLMRTIRTMQRNVNNFVNNFIVVLPSEHIELWNNLCRQHEFDIPHEIVAGGATRFESVRKGLSLVENPDIVMIHDGVRPLVEANTVRDVIAAATANGAAIPVIEVTDSLRRIINNPSRIVDNSSLIVDNSDMSNNSSKIVDNSDMSNNSSKIVDNSDMSNNSSLIVDNSDMSNNSSKIVDNSDMSNNSSKIVDNSDMSNNSSLIVDNSDMGNNSSLIVDNSDMGNSSSKIVDNSNMSNSSSKIVNRDEFRAVQTPQAFRRDIILKAYEQPFDPEFTDDASVVEKLGYEIMLTKGSHRNIKITNKTDINLAEYLLQVEGYRAEEWAE